jgi:hypothetical protein
LKFLVMRLVWVVGRLACLSDLCVRGRIVGPWVEDPHLGAAGRCRVQRPDSRLPVDTAGVRRPDRSESRCPERTTPSWTPELPCKCT